MKVRRIRRAVIRRAHRKVLLSKLPRHGVGAEVGVWKGDFSTQLLRWTRAKRLHLVDPWEYRPDYTQAAFGDHTPGGQAKMDAIHDAVAARFAGDPRVSIHRERSTTVELEPLDWVYIDGDHTHDAVLADLERFYLNLKPGGVLAGDDYGVRGWWKNGVQDAVDEFCQTHNLPLTVFGAQFLIHQNPQNRLKASVSSIQAPDTAPAAPSPAIR